MVCVASFRPTQPNTALSEIVKSKKSNKLDERHVIILFFFVQLYIKFTSFLQETLGILQTFDIPFVMFFSSSFLHLILVI